MIHFALICDEGHEFEGWFRSAGDFDAQAEAGHVGCPVCGSSSVRKGLMAPNVSTARGREKAAAVAVAPTEAPAGAEAAPSLAVSDPRQGEMVEMLRRLRDTVVQNTENVGKSFAEEARKMHYGEAEKRGIRGETNAREARELQEEGIQVLPLPLLPEDGN